MLQPSHRKRRWKANKHTEKKLKHYNTSGYSHYLTFSCYHRFEHLRDPVVCSILMEELERARSEFGFYLWAYVLMPSHAHLLIYPYRDLYDIAAIFQAIKGRSSRRYGAWLREKQPEEYERYLVPIGGKRKFRFWQAGGGFDRNLWNPDAIHRAIEYIEGNPVRANLAATPEDWPWSSAYARATGYGVGPDNTDVPLLLR